MAVQKFFVPGLTHEQERDVERKLRSLQGVLYAAANHHDACAEVEFEDDCVTMDELRGALEKLGFDARPAG